MIIYGRCSKIRKRSKYYTRHNFKVNAKKVSQTCGIACVFSICFCLIFIITIDSPAIYTESQASPDPYIFLTKCYILYVIGM